MRDHGGSILNITATLGMTGTPQQAHAGSAKAAIDALTRHLANEWGPNIRVNSLAPGPIEDTEGYRKLGGFMPQEYQDRYRRMIPLRRMGRRKVADRCCSGARGSFGGSFSRVPHPPTTSHAGNCGHSAVPGEPSCKLHDRGSSDCRWRLLDDDLFPSPSAKQAVNQWTHGALTDRGCDFTQAPSPDQDTSHTGAIKYREHAVTSSVAMFV